MKSNRVTPLENSSRSHENSTVRGTLPKPYLPPIPSANSSESTPTVTPPKSTERSYQSDEKFNVERVRRRSNAKTTQLWGNDYHNKPKIHHHDGTELDEEKIHSIEKAVFSDDDEDLTEEDKKMTLAIGFSSLKIGLSPGSNPSSISTKKTASRIEPITRFLRASPKSKLCKRVFRSGWSIRKEQDRQNDLHKWIIHPFSAFRWYWEMVMIIVLVIDLIILPVYVAFYNEIGKGTHLPYLMITFDMVFLIDIIFNFRTGYMDTITEEVNLEPKKVVWHYLKTWFIVDAISSIPFDLIFLIMGVDHVEEATALRTFKVLKLTKLLSLLRVLRMARLLRYVHRLEELLGIEAVYIRIMNLILLTLMISHWNGCMQYLIVYISDFPPDSWVVLRGMVDASVSRKYTQAVFRAMSHMLCIGYGKEPPDSEAEQWITMASMLLGASFYAIFIGNMSSLLMSLDASGRLYNEKIGQVKEYMKYRKLPQHTQARVMLYYEHKYQRKFFDEAAILNDRHMSHAIRKEIMLHNCQSLVQKVSFLADTPPDVLCDIISYLEFEVFLPGDHIIEAGRRGNSMYFIEFGSVHVVLPSGEIVNTLHDGSHFGEISLIMDERRVASIVAAEMCDVFRLTREHFLKVVEDFPFMRFEMERVVRERLAHLAKNRDSIAPGKMNDSIISMTDARSSDSLEEVRTIPGPFSHPGAPYHVSHHTYGDPSFHHIHV